MCAVLLQPGIITVVVKYIYHIIHTPVEATHLHPVFRALAFSMEIKNSPTYGFF
jgi:hypothetical protein